MSTIDESSLAETAIDQLGIEEPTDEMYDYLEKEASIALQMGREDMMQPLVDDLKMCFKMKFK